MYIIRVLLAETRVKLAHRTLAHLINWKAFIQLSFNVHHPGIISWNAGKVSNVTGVIQLAAKSTLNKVRMTAPADA